MFELKLKIAVGSKDVAAGFGELGAAPPPAASCGDNQGIGPATVHGVQKHPGPAVAEAKPAGGFVSECCKAYANAGSVVFTGADAVWIMPIIVAVSMTSQNVWAIAESVALCSSSVNVALPSAMKNTL